MPRDRWPTVALAVTCIAWVVGMVLLQQARLNAGYHAEHEDDALYHQMLYLVGHGKLFANTILPFHRPNHLSFTYLALWPVYSFLGGGWMALHVLKAAIMASGAFAVVRLARTGGASSPTSAAWGVMYLAYPPVIVLTLGTVRPLALAVPVMLWLLDAFSARRFRPFMAWLVVALLTREDLALSGLILVGLAALERREKRWLVWPLTLCAGWFMVASWIVLPAMMPAGYWTQIVEENVSQSWFETVFYNPFEPSHLLGIAALLLPLALLSLRRKEVLFGAVGIAAFAINWRPLMPNLTHLAAPAVAACIGAAALSGVRTRGLLLVASCLLVAHLQPWVPPTLAEPPLLHDEVAWSPLHPAYTRCDATCEAQAEVAKGVPPDVPLTTTGQLLSRFTPRPVLYEYGHDRTPFLSPEWIVLQASGTSPSTFVSLATLEPHLELLSATHQITGRSGDVVLLRRVAPVPAGLEDRVRALLATRP